MFEIYNPLEQNDGIFPSLYPKKEKFPTLKVFGEKRRNLLIGFSEELDDLINGYERDIFGNRVKKSFSMELGGLKNDEKKFRIGFRM